MRVQYAADDGGLCLKSAICMCSAGCLNASFLQQDSAVDRGHGQRKAQGRAEAPTGFPFLGSCFLASL